MDRTTRDYYDKAYVETNYEGAGGFATALYHRALERPYGPRAHFRRVIEVGSGHGEHLKYVRHSFDEYLMTDLEAHGSVETGHGNAPGLVRFEVADAESSTKEDVSFDRLVVLALCTICLMRMARAKRMAPSYPRRRDSSLYLPCDPGTLYRAVAGYDTSLPKKARTSRPARRSLVPLGP